MKKMTTLAALFATAALVAPMASMAAGHAASAPKAVDNWRGVDGTVWRNGTGKCNGLRATTQAHRSSVASKKSHYELDNGFNKITIHGELNRNRREFSGRNSYTY